MARKKKSESETEEDLTEFIEEAKSKKSKATGPKTSEMDPGRARALDAVLGNITKRFGEGSIMRLGEATHLQVETIPTGSLALDLALGVGGIPRGRVTEIYRPAKQPCASISCPRHRSAAVWRPTSIWNTRSIRRMPRDAAWILTTFISR